MESDKKVIFDKCYFTCFIPVCNNTTPNKRFFQRKGISNVIAQYNISVDPSRNHGNATSFQFCNLCSLVLYEKFIIKPLDSDPLVVTGTEIEIPICRVI